MSSGGPVASAPPSCRNGRREPLTPPRHQGWFWSAGICSESKLEDGRGSDAGARLRTPKSLVSAPYLLRERASRWPATAGTSHGALPLCRRSHPEPANAGRGCLQKRLTGSHVSSWKVTTPAQGRPLGDGLMTASGFASAAHGRNGLRARFFPLPARADIPRGAKKRTRRRPPRMLRAFGCVRGSPGPSPSHRGRTRAGSRITRRLHHGYHRHLQEDRQRRVRR